MNPLLAHFSDPAAVAGYPQGPPRFTPGFADMQRMAAILLAEGAPPGANMLVLGAGGGLELKVFAEAQPDWTFDGVDPAAEMLNLARTALGPLGARVRWHEGYIDDAPEGPFDGAACLLTLHFLPAAERRRTAGEVRRRLKPGAPFVTAHCSCPRGESERALWLARYAAFAVANGVAPEFAETARRSIDANVHLLSPEEDEAVLREAGFSDVALFYAGFTWRGWVAKA